MGIKIVPVDLIDRDNSPEKHQKHYGVLSALTINDEHAGKKTLPDRSRGEQDGAVRTMTQMYYFLSAKKEEWKNGLNLHMMTKGTEVIIHGSAIARVIGAVRGKFGPKLILMIVHLTPEIFEHVTNSVSAIDSVHRFIPGAKFVTIKHELPLPTLPFGKMNIQQIRGSYSFPTSLRSALGVASCIELFFDRILETEKLELDVSELLDVVGLYNYLKKLRLIKEGFDRSKDTYFVHGKKKQLRRAIRQNYKRFINQSS